MAPPSRVAASGLRRRDPWRAAPRCPPQSRRASPRACRECPGPAAHPTSARHLPRFADFGWAFSWRERQGALVGLELRHLVTCELDRFTDLLVVDGNIVLDYRPADRDVGSIDTGHSTEGGEHRADAVSAGHAGYRDR